MAGTYGITGSSGDTSNNGIVATLVTPAQLQAIYAALGATTATVDVTLGVQSVTVTQPDTVVLVDDTKSDQDGLLAAPIDATGGISNIGQYATYVANNTTSSTYVVGAGAAAFVEYQGSGPATIDGATTQRFIADTSHATGNVVVDASSANNSYSYLIAGPGADTLNGSTNSTASSVLVATSAPVTINAGAGNATVYGGGATTVTGGTHAGQVFLDFTANSSDSMVAGTGGSELLAVNSGTNVLDDRAGNGTDTLFAGAGTNTFYGSSAGTTDAIYNGSFNIVSQGADHIYVLGDSKATDTITGPTGSNVFDTVSFLSAKESAAQLQTQLQQNTAANGSATITFATSGPNGSQTVTFNNASHIIFK